jgi:hypothetical protein
MKSMLLPLLAFELLQQVGRSSSNPPEPLCPPLRKMPQQNDDSTRYHNYWVGVRAAEKRIRKDGKEFRHRQGLS